MCGPKLGKERFMHVNIIVIILKNERDRKLERLRQRMRELVEAISLKIP